MIGTLAEKGDFAALQAYTGQTGAKLDYLFLLQVGARGVLLLEARGMDGLKGSSMGHMG